MTTAASMPDTARHRRAELRKPQLAKAVFSAAAISAIAWLAFGSSFPFDRNP
jgi:hypothetical protein